MIKLKICGIKDENNAKEIASLDVDFMGLIFAKSPRQVNLKQAIKLSSIIHNKSKMSVGVFVNENLEFIVRMITQARLCGVQIHRKISEFEFEILKENNVFVWQVVSVDNSLCIEKTINADLILFDTKGKFQGGNGESFDWGLLKDFKEDFALAGGIGEHNINEALKLKPKIIDLNSKVEKQNYLKDVEKINQIIKEVKK